MVRKRVLSLCTRPSSAQYLAPHLVLWQVLSVSHTHSISLLRQNYSYIYAGGPTKILPSIGLFSVLGAGGQLIANNIAAKPPKPANQDDSWLGSSWSPLKKLTDQEYIHMLEEKRLRFDADIALIDERIAELRQSREASESGATQTDLK